MDAQKHDSGLVPFVRLPKPLLKRKDLTSTEKVLAALLMSHGRQHSPIYPSLRTLSEEMGVSTRSVGQALRSLNAKGEFRSVRVGKRCNNRNVPSAELAGIFGYSGGTFGAESDGKELPVTEEVSSDHRGRNFQSNSKSNPVIDLGNSNGGGAEDPSNIDAIVLAQETDTSGVIGRNFHSLPRIGSSHLEQVHDRLLGMTLRLWKVGAKTADDLVKEYPAWRIRQQLNWLPFRTAEKPAALLVKAIHAEYSCPQGMANADNEMVKKALDSDRVPFPIGAPRLDISTRTASPNGTESATADDSTDDEVPF
jgi:hypothetical protein